MPYSITSTNWQTDKLSLINIRELVFIQEQNIDATDEWDGKDETATHFLVRNAQGEAIGCARILIEAHNAEKHFHIGRVAVLKAYRQQGVGHKLMQDIIAWCAQRGAQYPIYLDAQTTRIPFYSRLGFVTQGEIFMDAGIPHIEMWYKITDSVN